MNTYSTYDENGRFRWISEQFEPPGELPAGFGFIEGSFGDEYYFNGSEAVLRQAMPSSIDSLTVPANGVSEVTISGLPNPTNVEVSGPGTDSFQVTTGSESLSFDTQGTYRIRLSSWPYLDQEYEVNAT